MPCALPIRSEEHTSELQSHDNLVCRLLLEKKHYNVRGCVHTAPLPASAAAHFARRARARCSRGALPPALCLAARVAGSVLFFFFLEGRAPLASPSFPPPAPFVA